MAKKGERVIALSQDLIDWSIYGKDALFTKGEKVWLKSTNYPEDPRCNGMFIVGDAMNARFNGKYRGDIFFLERKDNISCNAKIYKKQTQNSS
jgi:hypothetical protein